MSTGEGAEPMAPSGTAADRAAIVETTYRYCWAIDDRDWDALRACFTVDATGFLGVDCPSVDAIVDQCSGFLGTLTASHHLVSNHLVEVTGTTATCRCYVQAQHVLRGAPGGDCWLLGGRYLDRFRRTDAGWQIERRDLVTVWADGNFDIVTRARG
jgi:hypothetical protein